jgi:hypothetical protein
MSYLKTDTSMDDKLFAEIFEIALNEGQKRAMEASSELDNIKSFNIFNPEKVKHDENGFPVFTPRQWEIINFISEVFLFRAILALANKGLDIAFSRFAIGKIQENLNNKDLTDFLDKQMDSVYSKHPNYMKCSKERFEKSNMFDYFLSEFRDKKKKDIANKLIREFIDKTIDFTIMPKIYSNIFAKTGIGNITGPISKKTQAHVQQNVLAKFKNIRALKNLFSKPLKILASKYGITLALGSVYEQPIMYKGTVMIIGIDHSPNGFRFVNLRIVSVKEGNKLVQTQIKNPPANLFSPDKRTMIEIVRKICQKSTKQIQKEIAAYGNK